MTTGTTDQPIAQTRRNGAGLNVLLSLTLLGLLMLMWLALSIETTTFWTANNMSNLLRQGAMIAILAIGETFAIITGGIDLSVGAIAGFVSMMVALLLTHDLGLASSIGGAVAISLGIGIFIGLFPTPVPQGFPIAGTRIIVPGYYRISGIPNGVYYLLAAGVSGQPSIRSLLLPAEGQLHVASAGPISVLASRSVDPVDLVIRPVDLTDPPVLVALPLLELKTRETLRYLKL